ncbi:MAG: hypothetical protein NC331_09735 [Lachnospiraceae bacterium]|nr:hypothetical protein [Lachnospiraceae bacterium]MCM1239652.1 hypothetical protein [Lachnospiraceae bacterium]
MNLIDEDYLKWKELLTDEDMVSRYRNRGGGEDTCFVDCERALVDTQLLLFEFTTPLELEQVMRQVLNYGESSVYEKLFKRFVISAFKYKNLEATEKREGLSSYVYEF